MPGDEVLIELLSWTAVRDALAAGKRTAIVPVAAMEQHGPHMAIGTDTYLGYALAERLARALGNALVAPGVTIGYSIGHLPMPGTVTIAEETLVAVITEVVTSLAHHGFEDIVLLVSHGGNYGAVTAALPGLRQQYQHVRIHARTDFRSSIAGREALYRELGVEASRIGVHAGQGETSMMLATHPELVDRGRAVEGFLGDASIRWRSKVPPPMTETSPTGILGDARRDRRTRRAPHRARRRPVAAGHPLGRTGAVTRLTAATQQRKDAVRAITNGTVYTMAGQTHDHGTVLIDGGRIVAVGTRLAIPSDATVVDAVGKVVPAGFVESHSHVGLWGDSVAWEGRDFTETSDSVTPHPRPDDLADRRRQRSSRSAGL